MSAFDAITDQSLDDVTLLQGASVAPSACATRATLVDASAWNELLADFEDASFEQSATFAAGVWRSAGTSFLVVERNGKILGGACVVTIDLPVGLGGVAYVKHGPVWRRRDSAANPADYRAILLELITEYGERRGQGIVITPRPNPVANSIERTVLNECGFVIRRPDIDPNRFLVDVTIDEKAQLESLGQKWRYNLRAALKNGIEVTEAVDDKDVEAFAKLHAAMVARKRFGNCDAIDLISALQTELPDRLRARVFLARHNGEPVAGAVIGVHGDTAYYLFGATSDQALPLKAGYALQWAIVGWLRQQSAHWYDLGGEAGEDGLHQFKKGLVGKRGTIISSYGKYEYTAGLRSWITIGLVMRIRELQRVIYRRWRGSA